MHYIGLLYNYIYKKKKVYFGYQKTTLTQHHSQKITCSNEFHLHFLGIYPIELY